MERMMSVALAAWVSVAGVAAAERPNVVFILSDDQGWTDYGFMGHPVLKTPELDRLAGESLLFTRGYVTAPLCRPSLMTMVTGLYPQQTAVTGNDIEPPAGVKGLRPPELAAQHKAQWEVIQRIPNLPTLLKEAGYRTLQTGKWWEGNPREVGFTDAMTHGDPARGGRHGDQGLEIGRTTMEPIERFVKESKAAGAPFYIWYGVFLPHSPHDAPEAYYEKVKAAAPNEPTARYWANVLWFDDTVGRLRKILEAAGVAENTLIYYACDNGYAADPKKVDMYDDRSKRTVWDGGVRTPIFFHWPGHIAAKRDDTTLASSVDLMPTILKAAGLGVPEGLPGVDLLDEQVRTARDAVYGAGFEHDMTLNHPEQDVQAIWMVKGFEKIIVPMGQTDQGEGKKKGPYDYDLGLYDLKEDPGESKNLAAQCPERAAELRGEAEAWWKGTMEGRVWRVEMPGKN